MLVVDNARVNRVEETMNDLELPEVDHILGIDYSEMPDDDMASMIEKLCIINHLFSREFEIYK